MSIFTFQSFLNRPTSRPSIFSFSPLHRLRRTSNPLKPFYHMSTATHYNRIAVRDLLNEAPARGRISHRPTQLKPDIFQFDCGINQCPRRFATKSALIAHQRRSHAQPTRYECSYCLSTFSTAANLTKHVSFLEQ